MRGGQMLTTALDAAGAVLITAGVALLSIPAAFIVAGAACLLISWRRA